MSADVLQRRLLAAIADLTEIAVALAAQPGTPHISTKRCLENAASLAIPLRDALDLVPIRDSGAQRVAELKTLPSPSATPFAHARLLAFQSYLATTWAIADQVMRAVGGLLCTRSVAKDTTKAPQLWAHVLKEAVLSAAIADSLDAFKWPIALSYAVRNHCLHDGGIVRGQSFFQGQAQEDGFRPSDSGWEFLEKKLADEYKASKSQTRLLDPWPWHRDDLLALLVRCHDELDEALGLLARCGAAAAKMQTAILLGQE